MTFLKQQLNELTQTRPETLKLLAKTIQNLESAALNAKKFELDVSGSSTSAKLIGDDCLSVYITGEPLVIADAPVSAGAEPAVSQQVAKPKPLEVAILLTPKTIETVKVSLE